MIECGEGAVVLECLCWYWVFVGFEINDCWGRDGAGVYEHSVAAGVRGAEGEAELVEPKGLRGMDHGVEREREVDRGVCD